MQGKKQTNKQINNKSVHKYVIKPENWISSRNSFWGADVDDIFPLSKFTLPELPLFGIYNQNEGTNEITELTSLHKGLCPSLTPSFEGKSALG